MIGGVYGYGTMYGNFYYRNVPVDRIAPLQKEEENDSELKLMKRSGQVECKTCKNRKYQDGSNEMVSFKSPGHIDPSASGSVVRAHEQEHVANAYNKAATKNGQVLQASVTLKTAICPECGKSYVSGGKTQTQIKYDESNPYSVNQKSADRSYLVGMNLDVAV